MPIKEKRLIIFKRFYLIHYFWLILSVVVWILIGFFIGEIIIKHITTGFFYTNPMLDYGNADLIRSNKNINLEEEINDYIEIKKWKNKTTHISVYFRNLNNGNWFGVNEKEEFSPASLMKLPLLIAYYKLSEEFPKILKKKVIYIPDPVEEKTIQNIKPEKSIEAYKEYSIKELLDDMIIYSDNKASLLLENNLDLSLYQKAFTDIGISFPEFKDGVFENNVNIVEYASFFRVLYNSSYLDRSNSEYILNLLGNVNFNKWLTKGIPQNIVVSHKFGERVINGEKQLHDCWIVYYPNHPYIICVMTRGRDREVLEEIIAQISEKIYNEVNKQYSEK